MKIFKKSKKGFALIFVIIIAAAMMIPVLMLLSSAAPRKTAVTGEAVSDRALSLADSTVDNILNQINTFPFTVSAKTKILDYNPEDPDSGTADLSTQLTQQYVIYSYISQLNGGVVPSIPDDITNSSAVNAFLAACDSIKENISTYLYNLETQEYYAVWDTFNNKIKNVSAVGPDGVIKDESTTLMSLTSGSTTTMKALDPDLSYKTDNVWVEIDTNTQYWPGEPDKWMITATAYLLSKPEIKRTVQAVASRGEITSTNGQYADGTWYMHDTTTVTVPGHSFADYSGLYHTKVYFGRYETTKGPIRSDSNVYMGGWAEDPVLANGHVYDEAVDDYNGNHDGRFGPDKKNLTWAKNNGYAVEGYPPADWARVDRALYGSNAVRNPTDPNGGIQDKVLSDYYVNGSATIVFSVVNGVGKVTINGVMKDLPPNGIIFVEGTAIVSGKVKGQCTVGAKWINIGGNIIYNTPPRTDRNAPIPEHPDLLGLVSSGDITIPTSTFNNYHHLQVDAAMITGNGSFGIDENAPPHIIDPSGKYEAWWNGCQAMWNTSNAPAIYLGNNKVRGYEVQHTNYDWNLRDYGVPPYFPTTSATEEYSDLIDQWPVVSDSFVKAHLTGLTKEQLEPYKLATPVDAGGGLLLYYKYNYNGVDYYYGNDFGWGVTSSIGKTPLYRITWKEIIAEPITP